MSRTREEERAEVLAAAAALEAEVERRSRYKVRRYFQDEGPLRREMYPRHVGFMAAGARHQERLFLAANRIGKTDAAAYEIRCHLTGLYPKWWEGRRFDGPGRWWAAGDTMMSTRDVPQTALLGPHEGVPSARWDGMIDPHLVVHYTRKSGGVPNCVDTIYVQHAEKVHGAPATSSLAFKSYDQGRRTFQGTELEGVWLDEEPPDPVLGSDGVSSDIYTECLLRLMTTGGLLIATFTPLRGLTPFVADYLESAVMADESGAERVASEVIWPGQAGAESSPT